MLGAIKGCDEHGYPLEGVDEVPNGPHLPPCTLREEAIPRLVQLLQDANRRADSFKMPRLLRDVSEESRYYA